MKLFLWRLKCKIFGHKWLECGYENICSHCGKRVYMRIPPSVSLTGFDALNKDKY